ncbi:hypothetical protein MKK64_08380 [Methylobacterium sp. E-025]|uniref:hypothetical protein n=1 Tax=unclassified Methylobacterium TaxID=2615210 RepID=UPI0011C90083|nr:MULTISPECIES: hypothetical protein [unclassified Methylobacterium]MCJ2111206.1 hypothetical protein [Methylobacterium sp. E-025]TXM94813.1 hypothetical protein FV223_03180 [Methylobacterium sp. WL116]TXN71463.1 hypothetical protein FV230_08365 [Methylobacterium sp. WL6]
MRNVVGLPQAKRETLHTVWIYGTAAGLDVVLRTEAGPDTAPSLHVSVIAPGPTGIEDLAVFPNSTEGRTGADVVAGAVLHALEIAEIEATPGSAA